MKLKTLLLGGLVLPASTQAASFLTGGHIDGPAFGYDSIGGFEPHFHNEGGADGAVIDGVVQTDASEYEPDELIVVIPQTSTITVGGTAYYWLPETGLAADANGTPFLGLGLEELTPSDWAGGTVTLTLNSFSGPGDFLLWQEDGFGGQIIKLDTANNIDSFTLAAGSHSHYNWGFTDDALFELDFGISGTHVTDGFQSSSATYTFMIPEPSTWMLSGMAGLALALRRRRF